MRSASLVVGAFVLLALSEINAANGTILCKANDGTLKVRDTVCQKHEVRIDPASLGLQGPTGPQGPRGLQGPQGIPGPLPKFHIEIRSETFPLGFDQGDQTFKVSCLPGEIIAGMFGTLNSDARYDFDGNVWSWAGIWFNIPTPHLPPGIPIPTLSPIEINLVCLSLQS